MLGWGVERAGECGGEGRQELRCALFCSFLGFFGSAFWQLGVGNWESGPGGTNRLGVRAEMKILPSCNFFQPLCLWSFWRL